MTTISKLFPLLKKTGLSENESQEFIEIVEDSFLENLVTKDDIKHLSSKEDLHNLAISTKEDINSLATSTKEDINSLAISTKEAINSLAASTKEAINSLATSTKEALNSLAASTKEDIKDVEIRLIKWVIGLLFAQTGIIIAIIKLF